MGARSTWSRAALPTCTRGCLVALWVVARARDMRSRGRSRALFGGPPVGPARIGRKIPLGSFHSEASTRKFPLGSFQSEVPPRSEVSNRGSSGRSRKDRSASIGSRRHVRRAAVGASLSRLYRFRWNAIALSLIVGVDNALAAQCYWIVARGEGGGDLRRTIRRAHTRLQESGVVSLLKETEATFLTLPASAALRCSR